MLVVPDVQDVYTPLQSGLTVPLVEVCMVQFKSIMCMETEACRCPNCSWLFSQQYREQLEQLLENIPNIFQGTPIVDSALGAAIKVNVF